MSDIPIEHDCSVKVSHSPQRDSQEELITKAHSATGCKDDCGDNIEKPPLYFPQPEDKYPSKPDYSMRSLGPAGEATCSAEGGVAGLTPVADRYSITCYGPSEWRAHNLSIFQQSTEKICDARVVANGTKRYVDQAYGTADKVRLETSGKLKDRATVVYHWKAKLENAISIVVEEMELLEAERRRVKRSLSVIRIPRSIASELLQLRSSRLESDLVCDEVEEQLTKEIALCSQVQDLLSENYKQIQAQMIELKAAKARMESDWSDKIHAYNIDSVCVNLANDSPLLMWKAGATRFPADQSTPTSYNDFTEEVLAAGDAVRQTSITLRATLKMIYEKFIKEMRDQAICVDIALSTKVKLTEECLQQLENELLRCLRELASTEKLIEELRDSTKGLNNSMKLTQTRLENRLRRQNVENCCDMAQYALLDEAKLLGERISGILAELKRNEESQAELVKIRGNLEHEIMVKRKTLYIDKKRGQLLRLGFPSATDLSGF